MEEKKERRGGARKNAGGKREGAGRKPVEHKKVFKKITTHFNEEEYILLKSISENKNVSVSSLLREATITMIKKYNKTDK